MDSGIKFQKQHSVNSLRQIMIPLSLTEVLSKAGLCSMYIARVRPLISVIIIMLYNTCSRQYMLMLIAMTLTLKQDHSGLAKAKNQYWIISTPKQAISIKLATTVGHLFFTSP